MNIKKIFLASTLVLMTFSPIYADNSNYSISKQNRNTVTKINEEVDINFELKFNNKYNEDILNYTIEIQRENDSYIQLIKKEDNLIKTEVDNNKIKLNYTHLFSETGEYVITLKTEYQGEKYEENIFYIVNNKDIKLTLSEDFKKEINIYDENIVFFKFPYKTNLNYEELKKIKIRATISGVVANTYATDKEIIVSVNKNKIKHLNVALIRIAINDIDFIYNTSVIIKNEKELKSFTLSKHHLTMRKGSVNSVFIIKEPNNYKCDKISFSSNNENIAKVNEYGRIEAVGNGQAVITGRCDNKTSRVVVDVHNNPKLLNFANVNNYVEVGDTKKIELKFAPKDAELDLNKIYLRSSDFIKASVKDGMITGHNEGKVNVTFYFNHREYSTPFLIIPKVNEILVTENNYSLQVGDEAKINYRTNPVDISIFEEIDYEIIGDAISYSNRMVTAIKEGEAKLILKHGDVKKEIMFHVKPSDENLNDFSINHKFLDVDLGNTINISDIVIPIKTSKDNITVEALDDIVSNNGFIVKGIKKGRTMLVLKSKTTTQYITINVN